MRTWPTDQSPADTAVDEVGTTGAYSSIVTIIDDRDLPTEDVR